MENKTVPVEIDAPARANLMVLLMHGILERNLQIPDKAARARRLRGDIRVKAGRMTATLSFHGGGVILYSGVRERRPRASVRGDMVTLLGVVTGHGVVVPFLRGRVGIGGNPFVLLSVLPLITS
jgi:hypothetical protein